MPLHSGAFWNNAIRPSVSWCSCLGYRHAGCLQLSQRRPPEMCGMRACPRTDVDRPRFLDRTAIGGGSGISSRRSRGDTLLRLRSSVGKQSLLQRRDNEERESCWRTVSRSSLPPRHLRRRPTVDLASRPASHHQRRYRRTRARH